MPPSKLDTFHEAIRAKIAAACPDLQACELHYGQFNVEEVFRRGNDSPAAYVAVPTFKPGTVRSTGQISFLAEVMVVIISRHIGQDDAGIICRRIMEQIVTLAQWNAFGTKAFPPTEIEGNELHYDRLDKEGMAMNIASWQQELLISDDDSFFAREQSLLPDFSFPPLRSTVEADSTVNDSAHVGAPADLRVQYDLGTIHK